ncbi:deoxyribodipyrimidine photo-lyase [Jannaschia ovalis]|uniref:Deoxyribodipyrimidine photo-lyase n=1 Tax=Jannaschia ovalis TaxID=3038773 RepID=A0ABY8LFJ0_9RHOB|nr:deoxyribodipyrimidine photo-lyase [Jannaschia sp. GRR-S6-38]WGH78875.1 deoxyribodipyrimidine photo-lyase [Jannaschia sp. GRR-S6-38]
MAPPVSILSLNHALRLPARPRGPAVAVFAVEPARWARPEASARQWRFVAEWLVELRAGLDARGVPLVVRRGPEAEVIAAIRAAPDAAPGSIPEAAALGLGFDPCPRRQRGGAAALAAARGDAARMAAHRAWGCVPVRGRARLAALAGAHALDSRPLLGVAAPASADDAGFAAWAAGRTGWSIVDAAMRRARASGVFAPGAAELAQALAVHVQGIEWRRAGTHLARLSTGFDSAPFWLAMQDAAGLTNADPGRLLARLARGAPSGGADALRAARAGLARRRACPIFQGSARDLAMRLGRPEPKPRRADARQIEMDLPWPE